jgi:deoxyadenosine/deoxycytidine kinase
MEEVLQSRCYCPKKDAINWKYCEFAPSQEQMIAIYEDYVERRSNFHQAQNQQSEVEKFDRLAVHMRRNSPDKQFLLHLLMCIAPGSHIFEPGFRPANTRNAKPEPKKVIPDKEGLFRNSALLDTKLLSKRRSVNLVPRKQQLAMKLERAREKEQKAMEYREKLEADHEAYNSDDQEVTTVKISLKDYQTLKRAKYLEGVEGKLVNNSPALQ